MKNKILNIGPCFFKSDSLRTGGVVVLFEAWLQFCREQNVPFEVIDTNKDNYTFRLFSIVGIIARFVRKIWRCEKIFLHGTINDYLILAPLIVGIARLCNKKIFLRKFAGSFETYYNHCNWFKKKILCYVLKNSDMLFWETKSLVAFGSRFNTCSYWFPNVRKNSAIVRDLHKPYAKRFVFLSRVHKNKGVDDLITVFKRLGEEYQLDFYGPLESSYTPDYLEGCNYHYRGCIKPCDVTSLLSHYDVLLLPTKHDAEGYPGILLEAFSVGIPCIASRIGAIPEIVENEKNGILIESGNVKELLAAILSFNNDKYMTFSSNAFSAFEPFGADNVNHRILQLIG